MCAFSNKVLGTFDGHFRDILVHMRTYEGHIRDMLVHIGNEHLKRAASGVCIVRDI